jgi:hypothetical protein
MPPAGFRFMLSSWVFLMGLLLAPASVQAQELNASVAIQSQAVSNAGVDQSVFNQMQQDIEKYLNQTRFTDHVYKPKERIKCRINIRLTQVPSNNRFKGEFQVQLTRPVYNSSYETVLLKFTDDDITFEYVPFQNLRYSENTFVSNLTSLLNFYALVMLGFDYDSFGMESGIPYFERARNILNISQNKGFSGWQAMDGRRNRYWLIENMLNNSYQDIHKILYKYHRQGLDQMANDVQTGRQAIMESLTLLRDLYVNNPNMYIVNLFLSAKRDELIKIMRGAFSDTKQKFVRVMQKLDPNNLSRYKKVMDSNQG